MAGHVTSKAKGDWLTENGANKLALQIEHYWKTQGYPAIHTSIETFKVAPGGPVQNETGQRLFRVVSNIGPMGFPPRDVQ
jgi:hypothetical protein